MGVLIVALWLAQAADLITTAWVFSQGCVEGNPLLRRLTVGDIGVLKALAVGFLSIIAWRVAQTEKRWEAVAIVTAGILAGLGAAVWNMHLVC